jgi:hypothetical protein
MCPAILKGVSAAITISLSEDLEDSSRVFASTERNFFSRCFLSLILNIFKQTLQLYFIAYQLSTFQIFLSL